VIGHVTVGTINQEIAVSVTTTIIHHVPSDNTHQVTAATIVVRSLLTHIIRLLIHVIGAVKVDITSQETLVSVITTIIRHVLSDNIHLGIRATGVILVHQIRTIHHTIHVIGLVIADIINQVTPVLVITITTHVA
jgi:hypothetical protein